MLKYIDIIKNNIDFKSITDTLAVIKLKHIEIECLRLHDVMNSTDQWQEIRQKYLRDYDPNTRLHSHTWYELSCIDVGEIEYFTESEKFCVKDRNLFMMPPGIRHGWIPKTEEFLILGFHINFRALSITGKRVIAELNERLLSRGFNLKSTELLKQTVSNIRQLARNSSFTRIILEAQIQTLLFECLEITIGDIINNYENEEVQKNKNQDISKQISEIINDNIHLPIQLDDIARNFELTSRHLNRVFTQEEGISIGKFILKQKMTQACNDLVNTDIPIKSIAYDYGFSQPSYFCRIFKKTYGKSPGDYRLLNSRLQ